MRPIRGQISVDADTVYLHLDGEIYEMTGEDAKQLGDGLFKAGCAVLDSQGAE